MKKLAIISIMLCTVQLSQAQNVELIKYNQLEDIIDDTDEDLILVNFWATWCGPCIKELPHFQEADKQSNVKVILVSLDFPQDFEKVQKFVAKKSLTPVLYQLDEKDYDDYMPRVSENWSGAIPATLVLDVDRNRYFYEKSFSRAELNQTINKHLN